MLVSLSSSPERQSYGGLLIHPSCSWHAPAALATARQERQQLADAARQPSITSWMVVTQPTTHPLWNHQDVLNDSTQWTISLRRKRGDRIGNSLAFSYSSIGMTSAIQ